jgi:hypothetical protein
MKQLTFAGLLWVTCTGYGQTWEWANSPFMNCGYGLTLDKEGNIYTITDGSGPYGAFNLQSQASYCALAKHAPNGNVIWATGMEFVEPKGISSDADGNIYITGQIVSNAKFYGISNSTVITVAPGYRDVFVAKYNSVGDVIWVAGWGGADDEDFAVAIETDSRGNSYITGNSAHSFSEHGPTISDCFTLKFDNLGNLLWEKKTQWKNIVMPYCLDIDKYGNCYISGYFQDTAFFDNAVLVANQYISGFLSKYSATGNLLWAKRIGSNKDECRGIAVSENNNIYLTGRFSSPSTFDNITISANIVKSNQVEMFVAKLDSMGSALWVNIADSIGGSDIACDKEGNCYVTGAFEDGAIFHGTNTLTLSSQKMWDVYVAKYEENGTLKWAIASGGTANNTGSGALAVECDNNGSAFVTGRISGTSTFGNSSFIIPGDHYDHFLAKVKDTLYLPTGVVNSNYTPVMNIFPVPSRHLVSVECNLVKVDVKILVYDLVGQEIFNNTLNTESNSLKTTLDFSGKPNGIYFISLTTEEYALTRKIIIQ